MIGGDGDDNDGACEGDDNDGNEDDNDGMLISWMLIDFFCWGVEFCCEWTYKVRFSV